jgi:predicted NAD/FAD-binding protein
MAQVPCGVANNPASGLEYNGHSLTSLFAQRRNLLKPAFWGLLSGRRRG